MNIDAYLSQIVLPRNNSRKGENGRVLVIGGSKLFHAASFWSATMAAKIVDMVHFSSPAMENNDLMRVRSKEGFWDGIVVPWSDVERYIEEDDVILIGPGMTRDEGRMEGELSTHEVVNSLLKRYPHKKWVIDGGALQAVDPTLLNENMIVTPNLREQDMLRDLFPVGVTVLSKGPVDVISNGTEAVEVEGGNGGMTKGGTGDVLAGVVGGLFARSPAFASTVVASTVNKQAGENLAKKVGPFFSASDLISEVPLVLATLFDTV